MPASRLDAPLPEPSAEAAAISSRLRAVIVDAIDASGGWIPFSRFMSLALYAPGLGYYSAGAVKVGRSAIDGSDFATAPEISPLFARALARAIADAAAPRFEIVEIGGGTGAMAADLLLALDALGRAPARYRLLEVSADLRERQRATIRERAPQWLDRVDWLDALPATIDGIVLGNEVLDALPVDLVVRSCDGWRERGVVVAADGAFAFDDRPADRTLLDAIAVAVPDGEALPVGYTTEIHRAMTALVRSLSDRITARSVMIFIDYGFAASEYFHPQRSTGTLMAHFRHRSSVDVLARPGLQDLTSHVDFSAVARTAQDSGCVVAGYTSQASFLLDCGILDLVPASPGDVRAYAPHASALQRLLSEAEMGELFKVIAVTATERPLLGFGFSDRLRTL